jgi:hypothetical protein
MRNLILLASMLITSVAVRPPCVIAGESSFGSFQHVPGDIEAKFLVNLFRFVSWPNSPADRATVCFLRTSAVHARLQWGLLNNQDWAHIPGREVVVKMLTDAERDALADPQQDVGCQILYVDARTADEFWPSLAASHMPGDLLTVSNQKNFAFSGGMIQFLWEGSDTYRILMNQVLVTHAEVVVSGTLGTLVDRVDDARFQNMYRYRK